MHTPTLTSTVNSAGHVTTGTLAGMIIGIRKSASNLAPGCHKRLLTSVVSLSSVIVNFDFYVFDLALALPSTRATDWKHK